LNISILVVYTVTVKQALLTRSKHGPVILFFIPTNEHALKACGGVEVQIQSRSISTLDGAVFSASRPVALRRRKGASCLLNRRIFGTRSRYLGEDKNSLPLPVTESQFFELTACRLVTAEFHPDQSRNVGSTFTAFRKV
jgi:hypothetical protein